MDNLKIAYKECSPESILLWTCWQLWASVVARGNMETQRGRCLLHASAVNKSASEGGLWRGSTWRMEVWQVVQHCPHVKRSRWLSVHNVTHPVTLILSWQPCVFLSAKSHYMHLPCSTGATKSHALLLVRLYWAFRLDPLSSLKPHFFNLWHIPPLRKPLPVNLMSVSKIKAIGVPRVCQGKNREERQHSHITVELIHP